MLKIFTHLKSKIQIQPSQCLCFMQTKIHQKKNQKGQILLEYILLIVIVVAIAQTLMSGLIRRSSNKEDQGAIIKAWIEVSEVIAEDYADEPSPIP